MQCELSRCGAYGDGKDHRIGRTPIDSPESAKHVGLGLDRHDGRSKAQKASSPVLDMRADIEDARAASHEQRME